MCLNVKVKFFEPFLLFILFFSIVNSETNNDVLCAKDNVYSCKCAYYNNQYTNLPMIDIDCSAINILSLNKQTVIPPLADLLDFSLNEITVISNGTLISENLKVLILSKNQIFTIDKDAFKFLPNLTRLDLSDNYITKIELSTFDHVNKLQFLNLAYNQIKSFESHTFKSLQHLKELNLNGNNLGGFFENTSDIFGTEMLSPKLSVLKIENNNISNLRDDFFKSGHLNYISIARNNFIFMPKLPNSINHLDISGTQISIITVEDFSNYPVIEKLIMNDMKNISHIERYAFQEMKNLQVLKIENCKSLISFEPVIFGINSKEDYKNYDFTLRRISFLGSGLRTLNELWYPIFSRLSYLDLRSNPWTCNCKMSWLLQLNIREKDKEFIR